MTCLMTCDGFLFLCSGDFGAFLQSTDYAVHGINEILTLHHIFVMACSNQSRLVTYIGNISPGKARGLASQQVNINRLIGLYPLEMHIENGNTVVQFGKLYIDLTVETPCTQQRLVKNIGTVGGRKNNHTAVGAETIHFGKQLV